MLSVKKMLIGSLLVVSGLWISGCSQGPCCEEIVAPSANSLDRTISASALGTIGSLDLNSGGCDIETITLSGSGSENFNISKDGKISVASGATLTPGATYNLTATITNCEMSTTSPIKIVVNNPASSDTNTTATLENFTKNGLCNNESAGAIVGTVNVSQNGGCAISGFSLSGSGADNFDISSSGVISIKSGASLSVGTYNLNVTATNCEGTSAPKSVTISVIDCSSCNSKLAKTGQTTSYVANDDGDLKRGADRNFTRDDTKDIVIDNLTGLIWQDSSTVATATMDHATAVTVCDNLTFAGFDDWRLPTLKELRTILNYEVSYPAPTYTLSPSGVYEEFDNMADDIYAHYWTSTVSPTDPTYFGVVGHGFSKSIFDLQTTANHVRCVRGDALVDNNFSVSGDIVTDTTTCLQWQDGAIVATRTWSDAVAYCQSLGDGWTLPNANELNSIVDYTKSSPAINSSFTNVVNGEYWSSTTFVNDTAQATYVNFDSGVSRSDANKTETYNVRCVRPIP